MDKKIEHCQKPGTRWEQYMALADDDPRAAYGFYALDVLAATGRPTQALDARDSSQATGSGEYMGIAGQAALNLLKKTL